MSLDCCNCCNTRGKATVAPAAAFSAGGLPASLLADLFLWYKFDGLPGETFVTDYSGNDRHGTMAKNTQSLDYSTESLNPTTWGLKWGPAPGVGTTGSAVLFNAPDSMPSPNLVSVFFVINPYGGGNFNFSPWSSIVRPSDAHDAAYRPFRFVLSRQSTIGSPPVAKPTIFSSNTRGTGSLVANAIAESGSVAAGEDVSFSADRWRLVNYKRQGAGTTNHHFRINRKVQTLVTAAGDYVKATPAQPLTQWRLGNESSAAGFFVGYQSWLMIFSRNLTSPEELLVEDYIYGQMASRGIFLVDLP